MRIGMTVKAGDLISYEGFFGIKEALLNNDISIKNIKFVEHTWTLNEFMESLYYNRDRIEDYIDIFISGDFVIKASDYKNKDKDDKKKELANKIESYMYSDDYDSHVSGDIIVFIEVE